MHYKFCNLINAFTFASKNIINAICEEKPLNKPKSKHIPLMKIKTQTKTKILTHSIGKEKTPCVNYNENHAINFLLGLGLWILQLQELENLFLFMYR